MICPLCGQKGNLPGDDWCRHCQFDLMAIDIPMPVDRVERSLMMDPVSALGPREPVLLSAKSNLGHAIQLMLTQSGSCLADG